MDKKENKPASAENQNPKDQALDDKALDEVSGGAKGASSNRDLKGGHHSR